MCSGKGAAPLNPLSLPRPFPPPPPPPSHELGAPMLSPRRGCSQLRAMFDVSE